MLRPITRLTNLLSMKSGISSILFYFSPIMVRPPYQRKGLPAKYLKDQCEPSLVFWLVEELLDSQTIEGCRRIFDYLDSRRERLMAVSLRKEVLGLLILAYYDGRNTLSRKISLYYELAMSSYDDCQERKIRFSVGECSYSCSRVSLSVIEARLISVGNIMSTMSRSMMTSLRDRLVVRELWMLTWMRARTRQRL